MPNTQLAELYIDIKARTGKLEGQLNSVRRKTNRLTSAARRLTAVFRTLGGALGLGAGITGIIFGFRKLVTSASDVREAMNLVNVTFGKSSQSIIEFADKAPKALRESRGDALALLGNIGALAKSFKFTESAAAEFSKTVLQLSADVGSFQNARTEEVLIAIRAALVGSSEPMLRFGADTRQAALEQHALEKGIIRTKGPLTTQQRALAAVSKIMEDLPDAIGDSQRTMDEFANSSKILMAELKTEIEKAGESFLPFATRGVIAARVVLENLDLLKEALKHEFDLKDTVEVRPGSIADHVLRLFDEATTPLSNRMVGEKNPFTRLFTNAMKNVPQSSVFKQETEQAIEEIIARIEKAFNEAGPKEKAFDPRAGLAAVFEKSKGSVEGMVLPMQQIKKDAYEAWGAFAWWSKHLEESGDVSLKVSQNTRTAASMAGNFAEQLFMASVHGRNIQDSIKSILVSLAGRSVFAGIASLFPGVGFGGAFMGSFQHGGGFTVPGGGGPDSQLVSFRASPGERVSVSPPNVINNHEAKIQIMAPELTSLEDDYILETRVMPKIVSGLRARGVDV